MHREISDIRLFVQTRPTSSVCTRAAERGGGQWGGGGGGGGGGGAKCPGPRGAGAPRKIKVGPQSFLCVKYFRAKDKISVFCAKYRNLA
jgi:hypothetical protein